MEFVIGEVVSLSHYSGIHAFHSKVVKYVEDNITLVLAKDFGGAHFLEGDPVVLVHQKEMEMYTCECIIANIEATTSTISLEIENAQLTTNNRIFERFPVSLYAGLRFGDDKKKSTAIVKNMSFSGMGFKTKLDLKEGQEIEVDVYLDEKVIPLNACVIWKRKHSRNFEYGLKTVYADYVLKNTIRLYLQIFREEQESSLRSAILNNV